jgi:hypothetical protein
MQEANAREREAASPHDLVEEATQAQEHSGQVLGGATELHLQASSARQRAALAKQRELAAHARAIELHELAAALQDRLGYPDRAAQARAHAAHARELLDKGRAEQRAKDELGG